MSATGVWFGNQSWPSSSSPGAFARDVFRLEKCANDREKAMAFHHWLLRCMNRGPLLDTPGFGGRLRNFDTLRLFTSWGHNECTGWGWIAAEALQAAGLKARRAVIAKSGHTIYEVWYAGRDGKEGWHAFDPFLGWYLLNEAGEVASCDELAANPDLVTRPRGGGSARAGHHPERSLAQYYANRVGDQLDIVQPLRDEQIRYEPQAGQVYSSLWRPELPELAWKKPTFPNGAHCDITLYDEEGKVRYSEHAPYWKNYLWPTEERAGINGTQPVRWHGCGALRWQPLIYGEKVASRSHNAIFEDGTVRPSGARKHCEVWWHIKLPYLATYLRITSQVETAGGDLVGFSVSPDNGRSLLPIHWGAGAPPLILTHGIGEESDKPSIRGSSEFWLRLDMSTQSAASPLRVRFLQFTVGYQVNMHLLPRLLPGDNSLYLSADEISGVKLKAEWAYTHPSGEKVESIELDKSGAAAKTINPKIEKPEDLIMRGVSLRCEEM